MIRLWSCRRARCRASGRPACVPLAISTVNGSPARARRRATRDVGRTRRRSAAPSSSSSLKPSQRSPSCSRTQVFVVRAQVEHQHAAAGPRMRAASASARAGSRGVVQRLRQQRDVDRRVRERQLLELAALPGDVADAAARRPARVPRASTSARSIDGDRRAAPSARPRSSGSPRRSRGRRRRRRQQQAERARPGRPAAARHELAPLVAGAVLREVLLAQPQHLLQPRLVGARRRSSRARTRRAATPTAARARSARPSNAGASR